MDQNALKKLVGEYALKYVNDDDMIVGVGTGTTVWSIWHIRASEWRLNTDISQLNLKRLECIGNLEGISEPIHLAVAG